MKHLLVLVLCLALILPVMTAQAASIADVIGRWYLVSVDGNGLSGENYIEFNRNKSVTLVVKGQSISETLLSFSDKGLWERSFKLGQTLKTNIFLCD